MAEHRSNMNAGKNYVVAQGGILGHNAGAMTDGNGTSSYVSFVGAFDVLLGRGTGPSKNHGNVYFREVVEGIKASYITTASRKEKTQIVRKIVGDIKAKKGRFLNKVWKNKIRTLGVAQDVLYEVVPDSVALEKTKQAIRYVHYKKEPSSKRKRSLSADTEASFSSGDSQDSSCKDLENHLQQDQPKGPAHKSNGSSSPLKIISQLPSPIKKTPVSPLGQSLNRNKKMKTSSSSSLAPASTIASAPAPLLPAAMSLTGFYPSVLALLKASCPRINPFANLALATSTVATADGLSLHNSALATLALAHSANSYSRLASLRDIEAAINLRLLPKAYKTAPTSMVTKPTSRTSQSAQG